MLFILRDKLFINSKDQNLLKVNQSENLELEKEQGNKQASLKCYIGVAFISLIVCFIVFTSIAFIIFWPDMTRFWSKVTKFLGIRHPDFPRFIVSIILAPIVEEILFRKELFNKLKSKLPVSKAILISSFIFGCLHGIAGFFGGFIIGIWFCYIYYHTNDIHLSMLAHACNNFLALFGITAILFVPFSIIWWYIVRKIFYKVA